MANVQSGNTVYVDSAGQVTNAGSSITHIIVTSTAADGSITLVDTSSSVNKLTLKLAATNSSQQFKFEVTPIFFAGGITVSAISNASAMIMFTRKGS